MNSLQAFFVCNPPIFSQTPHHSTRSRFRPHRSFNFNHLTSSTSSQNKPFFCALHQDNVDSTSDSASSSNDDWNSVPKLEQESPAQVNAIGDTEASINNQGKGLGLLVFLMGFFARLKSGFDRMLLSEWFSWWPFWRREKRLEMLVSEADAYPKDAAKQTALLVELNKHSPESVIKRFEQREYAVDSRGVVEYIRALVATNAISEYLPDDQSGKPSTLSALLQELKERASGNLDESFLSPGISERQPLHVMMVDQKASNRSHFAQELISTILFTVAVGLMWVMGAAALQRYISGLGGMGTPGVGSSSSYSSKDFNKEIVPEKELKMTLLKKHQWNICSNIIVLGLEHRILIGK